MLKLLPSMSNKYFFVDVQHQIVIFVVMKMTWKDKLDVKINLMKVALKTLNLECIVNLNVLGQGE